jgi:hypothetical protein
MENTYLIEGFKNGYYLAKQNNTMLDLLMNLHHHPKYLEGLKKGMAEYDKTLEITNPEKTKLEARRNKLKQIKEREQGKEERER